MHIRIYKRPILDLRAEEGGGLIIRNRLTIRSLRYIQLIIGKMYSTNKFLN